MCGSDGASRVSRLLSTHRRSTSISSRLGFALDSPLFNHPAFLAFCTASFACPHLSHHDRGLEGGTCFEQLGSLSEATSQPYDSALRGQIGCLRLMSLEIPQARRPGVVQRQREASGGCAGLHVALVITTGITSSLLVNARNVTLCFRYFEENKSTSGLDLLSTSPERRPLTGTRICN